MSLSGRLTRQLRTAISILLFAICAHPSLAQNSEQGEAGSMGVLTGTNFFHSTFQTYPGPMTVQLWFNASVPGVLISELRSEPGFAIAELFPDGILKVGWPGLPVISIPGISLKTWRHIALTYDATAKVFSAYLDGQPAGSAAGSRTNSLAFVYALG